MVLQATVLGAWMRWARFELVGAPLPGCTNSYCERDLPFNIEYGLWVFEIEDTNDYSICSANGCWPNADGTGKIRDNYRDKCGLVMSAVDQACIKYDLYGERCIKDGETEGRYCKDVFRTTTFARDSTWVALVFAAIAGLGCLFECFSRHCGYRSYPGEYKSMVFLGFSTLLWIGGAVSVGGTDEYRYKMRKLVWFFPKKVLSQTGICLEGCQLALAAGSIAIVGGLVAMLLQCYRCAKSCDSGEEQTVSVPPINEKREPAAPAAEAEEARLATQAEEEIPAPVERPSFTRKLSSFLFGEEEPVAESEGVEAEAMGEQGELAPEGVDVEAEAMREQEELEPEV